MPARLGADLRKNNQVRQSASEERALQKINADAEYAVVQLNELFEMPKNAAITRPQVKLLPDDMKTAYYDPGNNSYNCPAAVADLPDITYWNMVHPFTTRLAPIPYEGQSGAIMMSYAYTLGSVIKQRRNGQTADTADWILAPKAVAWIKGEDLQTTTNNSSIYSLKAPGTAYDDPVIGKDTQVSNYADLYRGQDDNGGVHTNAGIGAKAFYMLATKIGSEPAARIWIAAYPQLKDKKTVTFPVLARLTVAAAKPDKEAAAIRAAWKQVGIDVKSAATTRDAAP